MIVVQVAVLTGELIGRFLNQYIQDWGIKRNNGVFEAEVRLWYDRMSIGYSFFLICYRACYLAMPLYLCGFLALGGAVQNKLTIGALIMGWGIAEVAVMINTVVVCK